MKPRISAALFDLDGTLLDSEPAYLESDRAFLAGYGVDYTDELNRGYVGRGSKAMLEDLAARFPDSRLASVPIAELIALKDEAYASYAPGRVRAFPATAALARALAARGVALAIASGSSRAVIDLMIGSESLGALFPVRVSSEEVPRGKPEPDVFIEAARRLGVEPGACLVLEDSPYGVAAAKKAGMRCVALPDPAASLSGFDAADLIVDGGAARLDPEAVMARYSWVAPSRTAE